MGYETELYVGATVESDSVHIHRAGNTETPDSAVQNTLPNHIQP